MVEFNYARFIAGIAVFVFAMILVEQSIKNLAGRSFKKFLQRQSRSKLKMIAASTVITGVLQSSSVVILMVLSFVGAGLLNMQGALAASLGCNIGTTMTSWIIAMVGFKLDFGILSYPLLAISLVGLLFAGRKSKLYQFTNFLIGFALIFIALEWFKESVDQSFGDYLGRFREVHYLLFIPVGLIITLIVQSSSLTVAIVLTALYNQVIPLEHAAAAVLGAELGTTVKFLVGSVGSIPDKRRVAWGNMFINLVTLILISFLLKPMLSAIQSIVSTEDPITELVIFQTSFNVISFLVFYPLLDMLATQLVRLVGNKDKSIMTMFIRHTSVVFPADALHASEKEIEHLLELALVLNRNIAKTDPERNRGLRASFRQFASSASSFEERYKEIKTLQGEILEYISEIPEEGLPGDEAKVIAKQISSIRHILRSTKNIKDIQHNLEEFENSSNDDLFYIHEQWKTWLNQFYYEVRELLGEERESIALKLTELKKKNRTQYDNVIRTLFDSIRKNKISELDSASLINVNREFYSSNKALLEAVADLKNLEVEI